MKYINHVLNEMRNDRPNPAYSHSVPECFMHSLPRGACALLLLLVTVMHATATRMEGNRTTYRTEARISTHQPDYGVLAEGHDFAPVRSATVRMEIHDNRIFVPLRVSSPLGKSVTARFWVDSGGDIVVLSGRLAHELGLRSSGPVSVGMGQTPLQAVTKPQISIASMGIDLTDVNVLGIM